MFDFFYSKKGPLTFSCSGSLIHSSYDPFKEAEKYIKTRNIKSEPPLFLLLYPGLNYIYDILLNIFPNSRFIVIHSSESIFSKACSKYPDNTSVWHPEKDQDLLSFLKSEISEIELKGLQIINWAPLSAVFTDVCDYIDYSVSQLIREYNGNINTTNYFGKRYFKNIVKNIISLKSTVAFEKTEKPVFITSSGPTLEKSAYLIKKHRKKIFLLSLSSSLTFLLENNIIPDLFLTSDPGFYSSYHLKKISKEVFPVAAPLTSYHLNLEDNPLFILNQSTLQEKLFLGNFPCNMHFVPQNGTVSGTALNLALSLTDSSIFFAGLDFCSSDVRSHCFPDEFSIPEIASSSRCSSFLDKLYKKYTDFYTFKTGIDNNRTSIQLKTYSSWFDNFKPDRDIYRINSTEININNFKQINNIQADSIISSMSSDNNCIFQAISDIDKAAAGKSLTLSLKKAVAALIDSKKQGLSSEYFRFFDNDILYHYSASVYLDIYGDFFSGDIESANNKYINLIDECISFIESLKYKAELYE